MFELLVPALSLLQKNLQFDHTRIRAAYIVLYSVSTVLRRVSHTLIIVIFRAGTSIHFYLDIATFTASILSRSYLPQPSIHTADIRTSASRHHLSTRNTTTHIVTGTQALLQQASSDTYSSNIPLHKHPVPHTTTIQTHSSAKGILHSGILF